MGWYGKRGKQIGKLLAAGGDVSDLGELSSIGQMYATERRGINDNFGYGANALLAQSGGENANILERARQQALDRSRERMGMAYTQGVLGLRDQAANQFQSDRALRIGTEMAGKQAALGSRLGYYNSRYNLVNQKGLFPTLSEMAANAGTAAAGF